MLEDALSLARGLAEKSPVAVQNTKHHLNYARDHSVDEGLEYIVSTDDFETSMPFFITYFYSSRPV